MSTPTQESSTSDNTASLSDITPAIILGRRRGATGMMAVLIAAGAGLLLIVSGLTEVGLFGSAAVAATLLVFGRWLFTLDPDPRALGAGSVVALTLAQLHVRHMRSDPYWGQ